MTQSDTVKKTGFTKTLIDYQRVISEEIQKIKIPSSTQQKPN
jgi:hypothetical protein